MQHLRTTFLLLIAIYSLTDCTTDSTNEDSGSELVELPLNKQEKSKMIVGTYTDNAEEGIYTVYLDLNTGELFNQGMAVTSFNPAFLTISENGENVYAINKLDSGYVSHYTWIDSVTLNFESSVPSHGSSPSHITLNHRQDQLSLAHYKSGSLSVLEVTEHGQLTARHQTKQHEGSGANPERQEAPHAHYSTFSGNDNYLFAVDLGIDKIIGYELDASGVIVADFIAFELKPGDGPRHMTWHPNNNVAFVVNELSSTVVALQFNNESGTFTEIDRKSTLPEGYSLTNTCADIHITENGKFLYVSNRGHNSIAVFEIGEDMHMNFVELESVQGDWPRNFSLSPDNKFLVVANRRSNNIASFRINPVDGVLDFTGHTITLPEPVCIKFLN